MAAHVRGVCVHVCVCARTFEDVLDWLPLAGSCPWSQETQGDGVQDWVSSLQQTEFSAQTQPLYYVSNSKKRNCIHLNILESKMHLKADLYIQRTSFLFELWEAFLRLIKCIRIIAL